MTNNQKIKLNDLLRSLAGNGLVITDQRKLNKQINRLFGCADDAEITINRKKEQVLVDVDGGNVQGIWSTSEDIDITVIDWDNIKGGYSEMDLYELGDYPSEVKTEQEILDAINEANLDVMENQRFFRDNQ